MSCFISSSWVSPCSSISTPDSISFSFSLNPFQYPTHQSPNPDRKFSKSSLPSVVIQSGLRELRNRINTVKNTQKITEAMKLVAAAKVRRAQEAVINSRPFTETVVGFLYSINRCAQLEGVDFPLTIVRPVTRVALVVVTGDKGLCGGFNNAVIKKANARAKELKERGIECTVISVGKKGNAHFRHRDDIAVDRFVEGGVFPTAKEAQAIADDVFSLFVSEEVDKVELVYTKFVSLVKSDPVIQTLLPLSMKGEARDEKGECVDSIEDEMFRLTSKDGKLAMERTKTQAGEPEISPLLQFEQDPVQILDAMMPLYLNSQILRALQESFASELASRMSAMSNATDNAVELKKNLTMAYNRERQAKITGELLEIVAGAEALQAEA
ncbi:PREDICTED: ATP synthase gamma chain 2, chloroplastic isoform X1 [Tarenaya hassleriana]|uniref:ATP synthase gamma chain 2, chloroplastic isoform X1 n=1 Tax=Tarenaya hassleriana TaxID=28532 RepID=UPI00053C2025|nr:PREDICTED: ATP synthase gamma chain 2, chloroplastic isoform X1 [Tarenaya hassleriana]XP_010532127.1 PREDICTED: ATP synthase gamma chain 2, chloroplastic isoform X1 [Tarenaya hassleriana]